MYGFHGKLSTQPGQRSAFTAILMRAAQVVGQLPGCRLYIVTEDHSDDNTIWVFEVWETKDAHDASLKNEQVRALIAAAMPLMSGAPLGTEVQVIGGHGL